MTSSDLLRVDLAPHPDSVKFLDCDRKVDTKGGLSAASRSRTRRSTSALAVRLVQPLMVGDEYRFDRSRRSRFHRRSGAYGWERFPSPAGRVRLCQLQIPSASSKTSTCGVQLPVTETSGSTVPRLRPSVPPLPGPARICVRDGCCAARHWTRPWMGRRRVRRVEKDPQRAAEPLGLLPVYEVAAVLEADQLAVVQQGGGGGPMGDGEDGVACSPEEAHGWKFVDFRDPIEEVARLAPPADDIAHGAREGAGAAWLGQVGSQQGDLGPGIAGGGLRHGEAGNRTHPALAEGFDQEGHGGDPRPWRALPRQTARGQQAQASNPGAALQQQPLSNPAAVRVADDIQSPEVEALDEAPDLRRVPVERVGGVRAARHSVPRKVQHQDSPARQPRPDLPPGAVRVVEAMQEQDGRSLAHLGPVERDLAQIDVKVLLFARQRCRNHLPRSPRRCAPTRRFATVHPPGNGGCPTRGESPASSGARRVPTRRTLLPDSCRATGRRLWCDGAGSPRTRRGAAGRRAAAQVGTTIRSSWATPDRREEKREAKCRPAERAI